MTGETGGEAQVAETGAECCGETGVEMLASSPVGNRLRAAGIPLTLQRLAIAEVLLKRPVHMTAEQVLTRVREITPEVSRATVYNTLKLFTQKGLVRELIVEADRAVYDSNTAPHYHMYDVSTGVVTDLHAGGLEITGLPQLPPGAVLEEIDVILRVRSTGGGEPRG